jgi:hypothetical protein
MHFIRENIERRKRHTKQFKAIFGVQLEHYFNNVTGFDIVGFDDEVIQPRNPYPDDKSKVQVMSSRAIIRNVWGIRATALIKKLIGGYS